MNVAEIYVKVLLATRIVEVAESKVVSLSSHDKDVSALYEKGVVSKNDLLASQVALADAQQKAIDARADLEVVQAAYNRAWGGIWRSRYSLAEFQDQEAPLPLDELTQAALSQRPELTSLSAQARALQDEAASVRGKNGPQVAVTGGYLYQQDDYIQPNGITGAMVGVEWNPVRLWTGKEPGPRVGRKVPGVDTSSPRCRVDDLPGSAAEMDRSADRTGTRARGTQDDSPGRREPPRCPRSLSAPGRHEYGSAGRRDACEFRPT